MERQQSQEDTSEVNWIKCNSVDLIQQGFIQRTPRGRSATNLTYEHLGLAKPSNHQDLF